MKKIILLFTAICFSISASSQITAGQMSDFEDGTTQGWSNGAGSPNPPTNIPTGGPNGADDNFLEETSAGGSGPGSRMVILNTSSDWTGDYWNESINHIFCFVKNGGSQDLFLRVAFRGGPDDTRIYTALAQPLPASQTTWVAKDFLFLSSTDFVIESGPNTVEEVLMDVAEIRIVSSESGSYTGDNIMGTLHIDNIIADIVFIGFDDNELNTISVYPNPAQDVLNISNSESVLSYTVHSITGQLVDHGAINGDQLDVSNLNEGLYFLEISNESGSRTIKFVKR